MWYRKCNLEILHIGLNIKLALYQHKHFHPSTDTTPSREDITVTKRIKEAGELMNIKLLDHIIIVKGGYYSFKENNMLD